jgi:hypothetical protein
MCGQLHCGLLHHDPPFRRNVEKTISCSNFPEPRERTSALGPCPRGR